MCGQMNWLRVGQSMCFRACMDMRMDLCIDLCMYDVRITCVRYVYSVRGETKFKVTHVSPSRCRAMPPMHTVDVQGIAVAIIIVMAVVVVVVAVVVVVVVMAVVIAVVVKVITIVVMFVIMIVAMATVSIMIAGHSGCYDSCD